MKVKTITCHNVYNYGATLQEYALLKYLSQMGHDAQTIDYRPDYLNYHYNFFSVDNPKFKKNLILKFLYVILKLPYKLWALPRKYRFDLFTKSYIKTTTKTYKSNQDLKNDLPLAELYIVGSDQVWNTTFQNGYDPSFYLDFVPSNKKRISYAASFAIDNLLEKDKGFVKEHIAKLNAVSVRETSATRILKDININNSIHVVDPVFLLESKEWESLIDNQIYENYILIYDFDNNELIKTAALKLSKKLNTQIVAINKNINYADKNFYQSGPQVFLNLVKHAEFVLANSFHALAFSIIFKKKFFIFDRKEKINTRMFDLLENVGLLSHYIDDMDKMNLKNSDIDYDKVYSKLNPLIIRSKNFLNKEIS